MPSMTKRVNVKAPVAIRTITPPIYGTCNNIIMTTGDILKCLCKRAIVEEILPDGSTVRLNMRNYYTDNGAGLDARKVEVDKKEENKNPEMVENHIDSIDEKVPEAPSEEAQVVETDKTDVKDDSTVNTNTEPDEDSSVNTINTDESMTNITDTIVNDAVVDEVATSISNEDTAKDVNTTTTAKKRNTKKKTTSAN